MTSAKSQAGHGSDAIRELINDAQLIADVAVRLGKLQDLQLLSDIAALKNAADSGADCTDAITSLQSSLNASIKAIEPITLRDLRSGWSPFSNKSKGAAIISFGLFAILLICLTAYATSFYNRVTFAHAPLIEIQTARVSEQVMKFYDLLRFNQTGMIQAFKGGSTRDVIIENFYKSYFDLKTTDEKLAVMVKESLALTAEAPVLSRLTEIFPRVAAWFGAPGVNDDQAELEKNRRTAQEWRQNYGKPGSGSPPFGSGVAVPAAIGAPGAVPPTANPPAGAPVMANPPGTMTPGAGSPGGSGGGGQGGPEAVESLTEALRLFFFNAAAFIVEARLSSMNPMQPIPIYETILRLHEAMNIFGLWYLPALYGMLGSTVFHMRRFLDPNIPNPSSIRTAYRIFLGAFAGIVVVWFWAPSPKSAEPVVSALSSFTVAFLVGFSIDIFFQALDRLVTKVGQAIG